MREAKDGDEVRPGLVLIAPGGKQMGIKTLRDKVVVTVNDDPAVNRHKPSVDYLFKSVAETQARSTVAAVLTGMGADGARELKTLRDRGAKTLAQDEATSVVYGMPREAAKLGGAELIVFARPNGGDDRGALPGPSSRPQKSRLSTGPRRFRHARNPLKNPTS